MSIFNIHNKDTAPTESAALLATAEKSYGFIPNILGAFAESPATLKAYLAVGKIFEESSFSPTERQLIVLTVSRFNECRYCVAAHSTIAAMQEIPANVADAIRNDQPIADNRLEALRVFITAVLENRAWVSEDDTDAFLGAGYTRAQILEVILGISFKTLSNYVNHFADTPLDDAFAAKAWAPLTKRLAS